MLTERTRAKIRRAVRDMLKDIGVDPEELRDMPIEYEEAPATRSAGKE